MDKLFMWIYSRHSYSCVGNIFAAQITAFSEIRLLTNSDSSSVTGESCRKLFSTSGSRFCQQALAGLFGIFLMVMLTPGVVIAANGLTSNTSQLMAKLSAVAVDADSRRRDRVSAAVDRLGDLGYSIIRGEKTWLTSVTPACNNAQAMNKDLVYYVNNPNTLYGHASLPIGPLNLKTSVYPFQGDDVLIVYGYTPPPITYYSFTMNQKRLYDQENQVFADTNSSIGLSINQDNLKTQNGAPFEDFFALIVTANYAAADMATNFLTTVGVPVQAINYMHFPQRFTSWNTAFPDDLNFLTRLTFRTQAEADIVCGFARQTSPAMGVLYFKGPGGPGEVDDADLLSWVDTLRVDSSEWDAAMDLKLDELVDSVRQDYEAQGYTLQSTGRELLRHVNPENKCRLPKRACNFDAPDALYGQFLCDDGVNPPQICAEPLPNLKELIVIVGVNHHRFGSGKMSAYTSFAVTRKTDLQGIASIVDVETLGSAAEFVEGTLLDPDDFFVVRVTRDCAGQASCMEVPWLAIPPNGPILITTRNYLDRETAAGPNPDNFIPARLLRFSFTQ